MSSSLTHRRRSIFSMETVQNWKRPELACSRCASLQVDLVAVQCQVQVPHPHGHQVRVDSMTPICTASCSPDAKIPVCTVWRLSKGLSEAGLKIHSFTVKGKIQHLYETSWTICSNKCCLTDGTKCECDSFSSEVSSASHFRATYGASFQCNTCTPGSWSIHAMNVSLLTEKGG